MTSLLMKIHQINDCLDIVCDTESDILDSSFMGLFKRKDYVGNDGKLRTVVNKLSEIHDSLLKFDCGDDGINMVAEDAKDYAFALVCSTGALIVINSRLGEKANGKKYSMSEHNELMNTFQKLQRDYMSLGAKLNADYKLYAYEIAKLGS